MNTEQSIKKAKKQTIRALDGISKAISTKNKKAMRSGITALQTTNDVISSLIDVTEIHLGTERKTMN